MEMKELSGMSDKEKVEYLVSILTSDEFKDFEFELETKCVDIIKSISDDDLKMKTLKGYLSGSILLEEVGETDFQKRTASQSKSSIAVDVATTLESDEKKLEYYSGIKSGPEYDYDRARILASLKGDNIKLEMLGRTGGMWEKEGIRATVIAGLSGDEKKLEFLKGIKANHNKVIIIKSLSSDEKKMELADTLDEMSRKDVLSSISENAKSQKEEPIQEEVEQDIQEEIGQEIEEKVEREIREINIDETNIEVQEDLSIEELEARARELEERAERNSQKIDELEKSVEQESRRKDLIEIIKAKQALIEKQEKEISELSAQLEELHKGDIIQEKEDNKAETGIGE